MWTQDLPEKMILVDLPREPELGEELERIHDLVGKRGDCDVVLDFENVDILNSNHLARLLRLRQKLREDGRRLVLCNVGDAVQGILAVTALTQVFEVVGDRSDALAVFQARS